MAERVIFFSCFFKYKIHEKKTDPERKKLVKNIKLTL